MNKATERLMLQLKALADPVRLRLVALCTHGECSVSELTGVLAQSQPRISQHLKQLCDAGLLQRFRDGHFVYYRIGGKGGDAALRRRLLALVPQDEPLFYRDIERLRELRSSQETPPPAFDESDRSLHRALVELTVAAPIGDLIDIGSGQGRILKLLASRAQRAVGVDIDSNARRFARAELLLAGLPNCTLRKGDMYELPFQEGEFDTIILDDVLSGAERPTAVLDEARRLLRPGGRLLLLAAVDSQAASRLGQQFARWCALTGLRLAAPRRIPAENPRWLLAVATTVDHETAAA
jgi:ArsR family transcriptional regulator